MNNNKIRKLLCLLLSVMLIMLTACSDGKSDTEQTTVAEKEEFVQPTFTDAPSSVSKSETVYVNLSPDGAITSTLVTDWLHTDKAAVRVNDISTLSDIENVKSEILPIIDGEKVVWNMDTTDLYYSGSTDKAPDVMFDISYNLDGADIMPEELAGKNGHLKINISIKNNGVKSVDVNGKTVEIYNPVIAVGGFMLPEEGFSATTIEGGRLIGDGTKQIAVIAGLPGFQDSLGLSDDDLKTLSIDLSSDYIIEADVTDFQLGNMLFAVVPMSTLSLDLGLTLSLDDVQSALGLVNAIRETFTSINADELIDIFVNHPEKIDEVGTMLTDSVSLYNENKALIDLFTSILTPENVTALQKLMTDLQKVDLEQLVELMSNPVFKVFFQNLPTLAADLEAVLPAVNQLNEGLQNPEVAKSIENLPQTAEKLTAIKGTIDDNSDLITALTDVLTNENVDDLSAEIFMLSDLLNTGDLGENIEKLFDNSDEIIGRLNAWLEYSEQYSIFTAAADGVKTNVMFVYETTSI